MGKEPVDKTYEFEAYTHTLENDEIEFIAITDKYVPTKLLENLNKWGTRQPVLYRHSHPAKREGGQILGRSLQSDIVEYKGGKAIKVKAKLFSLSEVQKKAVKYIKAREKAGKPLKVSIGFQEFYNNERDPIDAQIYEYSLTHIPVCDECIVGVPKLTNEKEMEKFESEIDELQKSLDESIGKTKELEKEKRELEAKVKDYEDKYLAQKDELATLNSNYVEMEKKIDYLSKKPLIDSIFELEKDEDLLEIYKSWTAEKLLERKKKVESRSAKIETQTTAEMEKGATSSESKEKLKTQLKNFESAIDSLEDGPAKRALQWMRGLN